MGPRSIKRGRAAVKGQYLALGYASMGPRSIKRGRDDAEKQRQHEGTKLQWGRAQLSAEGTSLLLVLVQVRNTLFATACTGPTAFPFMVSGCLVIICLLEGGYVMRVPAGFVA